jgi:hypothetical protein
VPVKVAAFRGKKVPVWSGLYGIQCDIWPLNGGRSTTSAANQW